VCASVLLQRRSQARSSAVTSSASRCRPEHASIARPNARRQRRRPWGRSKRPPRQQSLPANRSRWRRSSPSWWSARTVANVTLSPPISPMLQRRRSPSSGRWCRSLRSGSTAWPFGRSRPSHRLVRRNFHLWKFRLFAF